MRPQGEQTYAPACPSPLPRSRFLRVLLVLPGAGSVTEKGSTQCSAGCQGSLRVGREPCCSRGLCAYKERRSLAASSDPCLFIPTSRTGNRG